MGVQILFSKKDPSGGKSNLNKNFWRHDYKMNHQFERSRWGTNSDITNAKILPRGKAFHRLQAICLSATMKK